MRWLRSLVHRVTRRHRTAIRVCRNQSTMWCPVCRYTWEAGVQRVGPYPDPPPPKQRPIDR